MERDDEIKALRAHLIRLEASLAEAKARLDSLEQAPAPVSDMPEELPSAAKAELEPPAASIAPPPLPAVESVPSAMHTAAPPPLPWERTADEVAGPVVVETRHAPEQAPTQAHPPKPSPWRATAAKKRRRFGPPEGMDFETALGTWWLPRIGIVILSVGIVFLLTWAGNRLFSGWMRPYLQVAGGYAVCAGLLIAAKRLEHSARNYARVLASGGFALSYFTTFAAHFVVKPAVIGSEILTGLLLFAVVLAWGVVAQRRKSPLLGLGVTLLGHLTIFLSLKAADTGAGLSTASLLLFSLGSAFFLVKNRWYSVGAAGMICSYLNLAVLLENQVFVSHTVSTVGAVALLAVVYAVFALAELFAPEELRRRDMRLSLRSAFVATNTFCAVGLAWLLWNNTGGPLPGIHVLYGGAGLVVLVIARTYYHARHGDPLYNIYQIKGLSLLTLAAAKYFSGEQLAVTLAVEALLLLLNSAVTGFVVSRVFSWLCAALSAGVMAFAVYQLGPEIGDSEHRGALYAMWIVFALLNAAGVVYLKVDWRSRGLKSDAVPFWARNVLSQLDLLDEVPAPWLVLDKRDKSGPRPSWEFYFTLAAFVPWLVWLLPGHAGSDYWRGEAIAAGSLLALGLVGAALRSWNLTVPLAFIAIALMTAIYLPGWPTEHSWQITHPWEVGFVALFLLLLAEIARISRGRAPGLWPSLFSRPRGSAHWFALLAAPPLLHSLGEVVPQNEMAAVCAMTAAFFALYTAATNAVFWQTTIVFQGLAAFGAIVSGQDLGMHWDGGQLGLFAAMAVPAFLAQPGWFPGRAGLVRFRQLPIALWLAGALWLALFVRVWDLPEPWPGYAAAALAGVGLLLCAPFDARVFSLLALLTVAGTIGVHALDFTGTQDLHWKASLLAVIGIGFATERTMAAKGLWLRARLNDLAITAALLGALMLIADAISGPLSVTISFAAGVGFLLYAGQRRLYITAAAGGILAIIATLLAVQGGLVDFREYPLLGPIASTGAALAFWAAAEWGLRTRGTKPEMRNGANALALLVCGLLLCMLYQVDALANFYLTIAWTFAAVGMMAVGAFTGQAFYRYGALATFGIVTLRAALWDTRQLELFTRTISWMLLGIVLLLVAYGYIRVRGKKE